MRRTNDDRVDASAVSRRGFLTFAVGAAGGVTVLGSASPAAAANGETPKLPGEYFRRAAQRTAAGTVFDDIAVRIDGDPARLFVPRTVRPGSGVATPVVWLFHGGGSDHNSIADGFAKTSHAVVDRGMVAICQNAGGTLFSHPRAVALQRSGYAYLSGVFAISMNVLRATSAGGALAAEAYATRLIPNIAGLYDVNATYDIRAHYNAGGRSRDGVIAVFGDDPAAIDAANPARHATAAWGGSRLRVVVASPSSSDTVVPPTAHGLALRSRALPSAAEASLRTHTGAHTTPSFATSDFLEALRRWVSAGPGPAPDTAAPVVRVTAPVGGAVISGRTTVLIAATDAVGVADVGIYLGASRAATAKRGSGDQWSFALDTRTSRTPNGAYTVSARATDAAGNVGLSAPVEVTIKN